MAETDKARYKYSLKERILLVACYYKYSGNYKLIFQDFHKQFPDAPTPSRQTVFRMHLRFQRTGSITDLPRFGRPRTAITAEPDEMPEDLTLTERKSSDELELSSRSLGRLIDEFGMKECSPHVMLALSEDGPDLEE